MQNPVPDERYSVADEAILGAFFKLIKKKTPDQITVSDITKQLVSREALFIIIIRTSPLLYLLLKKRRSMMFSP